MLPGDRAIKTNVYWGKNLNYYYHDHGSIFLPIMNSLYGGQNILAKNYFSQAKKMTSTTSPTLLFAFQLIELKLLNHETLPQNHGETKPLLIVFSALSELEIINKLINVSYTSSKLSIKFQVKGVESPLASLPYIMASWFQRLPPTK